MTTKEKIEALLNLAKQIAPQLPPGDDLRNRAVYAACSLYRNRFGRAPTQNVIDQARFGQWYTFVVVK